MNATLEANCPALFVRVRTMFPSPWPAEVFEHDTALLTPGWPAHVGGGTVKSAHGVFPVPAPATVKLLGDAPDAARRG